MLNKYFIQFFVIALLSISTFSMNVAFADTDVNSGSNTGVAESSSDHRGAVLSTFIGKDRGELVESFDERREQHKILFYMGVTLLLFVLLTAGFGVSMAMLGKEVFVQHMVCAGITVFLSIAHAVVAVVWFFPF